MTRPGEHAQRRHEHRKGAAAVDARWAWTVFGLFLAAAVTAVVLDARVYASVRGGAVGPVRWVATRITSLGFLVPAAALALTGAIIVSRRPRNTVGRVMLAAGTSFGATALALSVARASLGSAAGPAPLGAAIAHILDFPLSTMGILLAMVGVPLLFPDGRLPSRAWRFVVWTAGLLVALDAVRSVFTPRLEERIEFLDGGSVQLYDLANPLAVEWMRPVVSLVSTVGALLTLGLVLAAVAAVVVRFRRSSGTERQQMKWFAYTAAVVAALVSLVAVAAAVGAPLWVATTLLMVAMTSYPVAIGVAVLRHRLYDIDRIISRTVSYSLVVAVVGGVYTVVVLSLGAAVSAVTGGDGSDVVVAAATLAAAGLFRPLRARAQSVVDRRFNRTGYDARQAVETFARDVRDEVDRDRLRRRITETAATAVEPTHVSLWLADDQRTSLGA